MLLAVATAVSIAVVFGVVVAGAAIDVTVVAAVNIDAAVMLLSSLTSCYCLFCCC